VISDWLKINKGVRQGCIASFFSSTEIQNRYWYWLTIPVFIKAQTRYGSMKYVAYGLGTKDTSEGN